jgi:carbamoyl-phosphate synthase small subunit
MSAYIALADGRVVEGRTRAPGTGRGELVFTTAYTGYEESLTDPSYAEQVLTFSYPLIGNYGVREERFESDSVQPRIAIAREFTDDVADWLADEGIPAIDAVDTRELVTSCPRAGGDALWRRRRPGRDARTGPRAAGTVCRNERSHGHRRAGQRRRTAGV